MKIALCTLFGNVNLGNKLQNYALLKLAEGSENKVDTIVTNISKRDYYFKVKSILAIILHSLGVKKAKNRAMAWKREKRFEAFSKKYLHITKSVKFDKCYKISNAYDYFITGSDQVWHNWPCVGRIKDQYAQLKYFYLMFASPDKRVSFAPSFGFDKIPEEDVEIHRQGLSGIKYLSCREASAQKIIKDLVDRDALLLPDPTLCLSREEWCTIEKEPSKYKLPKRYILVYFLGNIGSNSQNFLDSIAKHFDAELINIYDIHHEDGIHNEQYYFTSPEEFIYLIHHAVYIATDSFHACVFSILYKKRFMVFRREEQHMETMFGRIENLITITGINNCIYAGQEIEDVISKEIDYSDVDKKTNILREKAKQYLKIALYTD